METKTILVTGGAGFIGSHLCEQLIKKGHKVISLDNYFTGSKKNHVDGVEYREGHTKDIINIISETPDLVYHLGEYSRVAKSIEEPDVVWDLNSNGTFAVMEFCRKRGCKIIYAGSSTKMSESRLDGTLGKDLSPYTWSKSTNTDLVKNYHHWYKTPYTIAYFYNVYGPRELSGEYGTAIEIFKQNYLNNLPLEVRLPGTQQRIFTHVLDTVSGLIILGEKGIEDEYSIAAEESYKIIDVANMFGGKVTMLPERSTSRPSQAIDTNSDKIKNLGWKQEHKLEDYIQQIKNK